MFVEESNKTYSIIIYVKTLQNHEASKPCCIGLIQLPVKSVGEPPLTLAEANADAVPRAQNYIDVTDLYWGRRYYLYRGRYYLYWGRL